MQKGDKVVKYFLRRPSENHFLNKSEEPTIKEIHEYKGSMKVDFKIGTKVLIK